jgi:hypothetical protein
MSGWLSTWLYAKGTAQTRGAYVLICTVKAAPLGWTNDMVAVQDRVLQQQALAITARLYTHLMKRTSITYSCSSLFATLYADACKAPSRCYRACVVSGSWQHTGMDTAEQAPPVPVAGQLSGSSALEISSGSLAAWALESSSTPLYLLLAYAGLAFALVLERKVRTTVQSMIRS